MQKLKLGILGCGVAAHAIHLPILHRLKDKYVLTAVCDQYLDRALQTAQTYGIEKSFSSLEKMLQEPFDMLVILNLNHEDPIEKGLEAKKHIFTEKPISLDLKNSYRLQEKAKQAGLGLNVGLMRFYDPLIRQLKQKTAFHLVDSGFFYKYDGSDAHFRKLIFPPNMDIYTFQKSEPPKIPLGFNEVQLFALKTLLWSGIHQLSTMLCLFEGLEPLICRVKNNFSSLFCLFETSLGHQISLNIGSSALPLYEEKALLFGKNQKIECAFSSPYLNISHSTLNVVSEENEAIINQQAHFYETAFQKMWEETYESMVEKRYPSSLFAVKVEELARKSSEIAVMGVFS